MTPEKERVYQKLYEEYTNTLYQYIYRRVGVKSDTEDVIHEVFIALLFHLDEFIADYPHNLDQIRSWLFGVARNKLRHYWRKNAPILDTEVSMELLPDLPDPHGSLDEDEFSFPDWLKDEDKKLLLLKYSGYSLREVAARMGLTYGACRMRSCRLEKELKIFWKNKK